MACHPEVLMSIRDEWATAILKRTKHWEFRRRCGLAAEMRVWIYATVPPGQVVGVFTIGEIRTVSAVRPDPELCRAGAVSPAELRDYFKGLQWGTAVEVTHRQKLTHGVSLPRGQRGPQSYRFLKPGGPDRRLVQRLNDALP